LLRSYAQQSLHQPEIALSYKQSLHQPEIALSYMGLYLKPIGSPLEVINGDLHFPSFLRGLPRQAKSRPTFGELKETDY
jgi:hypothetical protein